GGGVRLWSIESSLAARKYVADGAKSILVGSRPRLCPKNSEIDPTRQGPDKRYPTSGRHAEAAEPEIVPIQEAEATMMVLAVSSTGVDVRRLGALQAAIVGEGSHLPTTGHILTGAFDPTRQGVVLVDGDGRLSEVWLDPSTGARAKDLGRL